MSMCLLQQFFAVNISTPVELPDEVPEPPNELTKELNPKLHGNLVRDYPMIHIQPVYTTQIFALCSPQCMGQSFPMQYAM